MLPVDSDSVVAIVGLFGLMMSFSLAQALVAPLLLASPLYTACQKKVPALLKVTPLESGTFPPATVTVPPASAVAPVSVAESCTVSPMLPVDSDSVVAIVGLFGLMMSFSLAQALVAPLLLASPLYTACQKKVPA